MYELANLLRAVVFATFAATAMVTPFGQAAANDDATEAAAATVDQKYRDHEMDVKRLFAARCSWCHQGYGMKQADGPKLAGTRKTREEVIEQIARGKSPMPGFRNQLKQHQIEALADYIKALPND